MASIFFHPLLYTSPSKKKVPVITQPTAQAVVAVGTAYNPSRPLGRIVLLNEDGTPFQFSGGGTGDAVALSDAARVAAIAAASADATAKANAAVAAAAADATNKSTAAQTAAIADANNTKQPKDADLTAIAGLAGVQGDIIFRDGTQWQRLPAGTPGHALKTNGPGANPGWGLVSGSGASTFALLTDVALDTPANYEVPMFIGANLENRPLSDAPLFSNTVTRVTDLEASVALLSPGGALVGRKGGATTVNSKATFSDIYGANAGVTLANLDGLDFSSTMNFTNTHAAGTTLNGIMLTGTTSIIALSGTPFTSADVGRYISGPGIPSAVTITAVADSTHATISSASLTNQVARVYLSPTPGTITLTSGSSSVTGTGFVSTDTGRKMTLTQGAAGLPVETYFTYVSATSGTLSTVPTASGTFTYTWHSMSVSLTVKINTFTLFNIDFSMPPLATTGKMGGLLAMKFRRGSTGTSHTEWAQLQVYSPGAGTYSSPVYGKWVDALWNVENSVSDWGTTRPAVEARWTLGQATTLQSLSRVESSLYYTKGS